MTHYINVYQRYNGANYIGSVAYMSPEASDHAAAVATFTQNNRVKRAYRLRVKLK